MSENINDLNLNDSKLEIPIYDIEVPELDDTNYASTLNDVFNNINSNFIQLANRDFVKGEQGTSVIIEETEFFDENGIENDLCKKLKACIISNEYTEALKDINTTINKQDITLSLWDNFKSTNAGTLKMIYTVNENNEKVAVSSLYYLFLDGRFNNNSIGKINPTNYNDIKDLSCILVYENDDFKKLSNAFPTIYYEQGVGLCWKLNGNNTGIPVQGIPGKNGENGKLFIVKSESDFSNDNYTIEVSSIFENGYKKVSTAIEEGIVKVGDIYPALIFVTNTNKTHTETKYYLGSIEVKDSKIIATTDPESSLNHLLTAVDFNDILKNIDIISTDTTQLKGLYIPLEKTKSEDNSQKVHLLSANSITSDPGDNSLKSDIILTPVRNINLLDINNDNKLLVEKYIYIKIDKEQLKNLNIEELNLNNGELDDENGVIYKANVELEKLNYILKYKLSRVVKNKNDKNFNTNAVDPVMFLKSGFNNENTKFIVNTKENESTYKYKLVDFKTSNPDDTNNSDIFGHYDTMDEDFESKLNDSGENHSGIYKWVLDLIIDENFDPEEFKNTPYHKDNVSLDNNNLKLFTTLFTLTMSPSLEDPIMWFNGITKESKENIDYYIDNCKDNNKYNEENKYFSEDDFNILNEISNNYDNENYNNYIIKGWTINSGLFNFLKFVPLYRHNFNIEDDTLLNINYNVNITGDNNNSTKNLTVHGSINCEDFKAYNIAAAGEIKNIYTKDDINADAGLNITKKNIIDDKNNIIGYDYVTKINNEGISTSDIIAENVSFKDKLSNNNDTIKINQETIEINNTASTPVETEVIVEEGSYTESSENQTEIVTYNNIDLKNINKLNISKIKNENLTPIANVEIPVNVKDNLLIVSNKSDELITDINLETSTKTADILPSIYSNLNDNTSIIQIITKDNDNIINKILTDGAGENYENNNSGGDNIYKNNAARLLLESTSFAESESHYGTFLNTQNGSIVTKDIKYIHKYKFNLSKFNKNMPIEINLNNVYNIILGVNSQRPTEYSRPYLNYLNIYFKVAYRIGHKGDYTVIPVNENKPKNDYWILKSANGIYINPNESYQGYTTNEKVPTVVEGDNSGYELDYSGQTFSYLNLYSSNCSNDWGWKYKGFNLSLLNDKITIDPNTHTELYKTLNNNSNSTSDVEFIVFNTANFSFENAHDYSLERKKNIIKGVSLTVPTPINISYTYSGLAEVGNVLNKKIRTSDKLNNSNLKYYNTDSANIYTTIITQDGIIFRTKNLLYGIGNIKIEESNYEPSLFYYDSTNNTGQTQNKFKYKTLSSLLDSEKDPKEYFK